MLGKKEACSSTTDQMEASSVHVWRFRTVVNPTTIIHYHHA